MSKDGKTKDIFFGIVAIATLIVAIIGATLAYFSITASSNEGVINATAATVSIEYSDGKQVTAQADQLIPSTFAVVQEVYAAHLKGATEIENMEEATNRCLDSNGKQVCSAYRFSVSSDIERTISATLNNEHNGFTYLSYALYDVTNQKWYDLQDGTGTYDRPINKCSNANNLKPTVQEDDDCHFILDENKEYTNQAINSLFGKTMKDGVPVNKTETIADVQVYDLVLFIKETGENQNIDQGKQYSGTIKIDVSTIDKNGQITGCVGDDC